MKIFPDGVPTTGAIQSIMKGWFLRIVWITVVINILGILISITLHKWSIL